MNNKAVKVLIIVDDAFVALLLREFLTKWGYDIIDVISDGEKAIAEIMKEMAQKKHEKRYPKH